MESIGLNQWVATALKRGYMQVVGVMDMRLR